VPMAWWWAV